MWPATGQVAAQSLQLIFLGSSGGMRAAERTMFVISRVQAVYILGGQRAVGVEQLYGNRLKFKLLIVYIELLKKYIG